MGVRRLADVGALRSGRELFPMMTLVCIPLAWSSARNGQATLAMAGMMMLATSDLVRGRWGRAVFWLVAAVAVKPLALVLALLAGALYRPLWLRLPIGTAAMLALPLVLQSPDYAIAQYRGCVEMLNVAAQFGQGKIWAHFFGMMNVFGLPIPVAAQTPVRLLAAAATLLVCYVARRRGDPTQAGLLTFAMAACYIMLMNPRTENNTYSTLAPAIALLAAQAWILDRRPVATSLLLLLAAGTVGSYELGRLITPPKQSIWLAPLMCVLFTGYVVMRALRTRAGAGGTDTCPLVALSNEQ
jgi:hypothetical protein